MAPLRLAHAGTSLSAFARRRPVTCFFTLAYLIFWIGMIPVVLSRSLSEAVLFPLTYSPTVAALLTHWLAERNLAAFRLYGSWKRFLIGGFAGSLLLLAALTVMPALILAQNPLRDLHWRVLFSGGSFTAATFLGGGPLGEEAGWRGYALPRLQLRMGPWKAALVVGILWACWHLPMFLVPGLEAVPFLEFAALQVAFSVILTFAANLSRFSIGATVMGHFALNSSGGLYGGLMAGVPVRPGVVQETVMPVCVLLTAAGLTLATRARLGARKPPFAPAVL
jgi:membrane protease YdiL (CAAX protease family)